MTLNLDLANSLGLSTVSHSFADFTENDDLVLEAAINQLVNAVTNAGINIIIPANAGINSYTQLTAFDVTDIADGAWAYITVQDSYWQLLTSSTLVVSADEIIASSVAGRFWVREMIPSSRWTFQYNWFIGDLFFGAGAVNNLFDGASSTTAISPQEWTRRVRNFSAGINGTAQRYSLKLITNIPGGTQLSNDFFPTGTVQSDGNQISTTFGTFGPTVIGFRRNLSVPGSTFGFGGGTLTAAGTLAAPATNSKATVTDSLVTWTSLVTNMIMAADTIGAVISTGATGSITAFDAVSGIATFVGTMVFTSGSVNRLVTISGPNATGTNLGTFVIVESVTTGTTTTIRYSNAAAFVEGAGNITWVEKDAKIAHIISAPTVQTGTLLTFGATVGTSQAVTVTGVIVPAAGFAAPFATSADIGKRIRITGTAGNDGEVTILTVTGATTITIYRPTGAGVADAVPSGALQGVAEVGSSWYNQTNLLVSATAPTALSPYCVVSFASWASRLTTQGMPKTMTLSFTDCNILPSVPSVAIPAIGYSGVVVLTTCRLDVTITVGSNVNNQATLITNLCCYQAPAGAFTAMFFQESGQFRPQDTVFVHINVRLRERTTSAAIFNCVVQGGYLAIGSTAETGVRPASYFVNIAGARGVGVFNNVSGSATNPTAATNDSPGAAIILGRKALVAYGLVTSVPWGIGALVGLHIKEGSTLMTSTVSPFITDVAGTQQLKIDIGGGTGADIPSIGAGGIVVAGAPITTWAVLAAGPYLGNAINFQKNTSIIRVFQT